MIIKRKSLIVLFLFIITVVNAQQLPDAFQLLPQPKSVKIVSKNGIRWNELAGIISENAKIPVLGTMLNQLPRHNRNNGIIVKLKLQKGACPESNEGYELQITTKSIIIAAESQVGLFYGCLTLEQLLTDSREQDIVIPLLVIRDYPAIPFRAVHFDNKHHLSRIEYYYRVIDKLSQYKINAIIWEIEDKLRYERRPEIGAPNSISIQDMQALSSYAKERNIEINPLIQGLGHAGFILKHHWELREDPTSDWEFCPSNPKTYEVQFDLYRDAIEAMPHGKYLHIGGDEISGIGICPRCLETGKSAFELQMEWLKKVSDFALENGRTPIFWDDMPLKYAELWWVLHGNLSDEEVEKNWKTEKLDEAIALFPKNCVYMRWYYDDPTILPHIKILDWYKHKGLRVMAATAASDGGSPFLPRYNSKAQEIKDFSRLVIENNLEGILATAWDDGSPHWETIMRGFIAQGEFGWNPTGRSVDEFKKAHAQREFGFTKGELSFLDDLEKSAFFFDGALVVEGRRNPSWQVTGYKLMDLPDINNPGKWSRDYANKLDSARDEQSRYKTIQKGIKLAKEQAIRNRYTLEIYEQTNHLLHYPAQLLLALESFDKSSNEEEKQSALKNIKDIYNYFDVMRQNLEDVYSKTRFMKAPNGYIADNNHHHHLSALTLNSDWLYLYEIDMLKKIEEWLLNIE